MLNSKFRAIWTSRLPSSAIVNGCTEAEIVLPAVQSTGVFFDISHSPTENLFGFRMDGKELWHSAIGLGVQTGLVLEPKLLSDSAGSLWLSNLNDGSFVASAFVKGVPTPYLYLVEVSEAGGKVEWKSRMTFQFTTKSNWIEYLPSSLAFVDGRAEMLALPYEGNPSSRMPVALLFSARRR